MRRKRESSEEDENFKRALPKELQKEEQLKEGEEACAKCGANHSLGMLVCVNCGQQQQPQPDDAPATAAEVAERTSSALRKLAAVNPATFIEVLADLRRTPYLSRAARLRKALKDYDIGATKGRKDRTTEDLRELRGQV